MEAIKPMLSTTKIAKMAGVVRKTVWSWIVYGVPVDGTLVKLQGERMGRQFRVAPEAWEAFKRALNGENVATESPADRDRRNEAARKRLRELGVRI